MPARPYMARLSVLSRLIWPSAWPLLQGSVIAFLTARCRARAFSRIAASNEDRISGRHGESGQACLRRSLAKCRGIASYAGIWVTA